jgi:hypothetical protein
MRSKTSFTARVELNALLISWKPRRYILSLNDIMLALLLKITFEDGVSLPDLKFPHIRGF